MTYRVFQWATGTVGRAAAKACLERDWLELVGVHSSTPSKAGRDVGEVLGGEAIGLPVTGDVAAIETSTADVVIHAPLASLVEGENPEQDLEDICRLLAAGKNVITVVGYLYPAYHGPEVMGRLEAACARGGSTFHSTGLNPGWLGDLVPLLMSSLSQRIDSVSLVEISNFQGYPSPEIMFDSMGFGSEQADFEARNQRRRQWLDGLFGESMQMVADGLDLGVDAVSSTLELALAPQDLDTAAGTVRAGTVAGQRYRWTGTAGGNTRMTSETVWRMHESVAPDWPQGHHSIVIEGSPRLKAGFEGDFCSDGLLGTAMHAVNAIPAVCQAQPGIRTLLDLPWILPRR